MREPFPGSRTLGSAISLTLTKDFTQKILGGGRPLTSQVSSNRLPSVPVTESGGVLMNIGGTGGEKVESPSQTAFSLCHLRGVLYPRFVNVPPPPPKLGKTTPTAPPSWYIFSDYGPSKLPIPSVNADSADKTHQIYGVNGQCIPKCTPTPIAKSWREH